jgi:hypothetical protein
MLTTLKTAAAKQKGAMFAMTMPTNAGGPPAGGAAPVMTMPQTVQIAVGDSAALLTARSEMIKDFTDLVGNDTVKIATKDAAKTISGVSFSQATVTMPGAANGAQPNMAPLAMFGMTDKGMDSYTGAVDANSLLTVSGVSDDQIAKLIAGIKASDNSMDKDPTVMTVSAMLPAERLAVMYFRTPTPAGAPVNEPVGISVATEGSAVRFDVYITGQTAMQIVQQAMQFYQQFAPQPAPGGAAPGGAPDNNPPPPMPGGGL